MTMPEELEIPPFPAELQQQLEMIRGDIMPERWMCVVRREKINYAVGRIIQVDKVNHNFVKKISGILTYEIGMKQKQKVMDSQM
jgi:hypothetical protein